MLLQKKEPELLEELIYKNGLSETGTIDEFKLEKAEYLKVFNYTFNLGSL